MTKQTQFYTVQEAAELYRVSSATIRRLIDAGKMHAIRVGRSVRIDRRALERMLSSKGAK
jgi:excisionase family DNA binding protein